MKPYVEISIVVYNNWNGTKRLLDSIFENTVYPNYKIILVDNASRDQTVNELEQYENMFLIHYNEDKKSWAACHNLTMSKTFADYVCLLSNDVKVRKNWLTNLIDCDVSFICVPTPLKRNRLDCSLITEYIFKLQSMQKMVSTIAVKSTVKLGFFNSFAVNHLGNVVYNPEFLHVKTRFTEIIDPVYVVLAGNSNFHIQQLKKVYCWIPKEKFEVVSFENAELLKLVMNGYASTKISFWNEIRRICECYGGDVLRIRDLLRKDVSRWTDEYTDPFKGAYGGECLPKDINELMNSIPDSILLKAVDTVNEKIKEKYK